jgi:hypothetical protein
MAEKTFDASKYLTDLHGRDYLEVKWRLLWLRTEHPDAVLETELIKHEDGLALFRARASIRGGGEATGWGSETADDFGDYIEKAETKALGRALAALGYGTQFCEDYDFSSNGVREAKTGRRGRDGDRVVDAPVARRGLKMVRDAAGGDGPPPASATGAQVQAIYAIGRSRRSAAASEVDERCRQTYGCLPNDLSKRQASEFIEALRRDG